MAQEVTSFWPSLRCFCRDCDLARDCPRSTVVEVEACPLVAWQRAQDRERVRLGAARGLRDRQPGSVRADRPPRSPDDIARAEFYA